MPLQDITNQYHDIKSNENNQQMFIEQQQQQQQQIHQQQYLHNQIHKNSEKKEKVNSKNNKYIEESNQKLKKTNEKIKESFKKQKFMEEEILKTAQLNGQKPIKYVMIKYWNPKKKEMLQFHCYNDKDLNIPAQYQDKILHHSIDNDCTTDDEQIERAKRDQYKNLLETAKKYHQEFEKNIKIQNSNSKQEQQ